MSKENVTNVYGKDPFGNDPDARVADPTDPTRVFKWLLTESYDDKGNWAVHRYKPEDSSGVDASQAHEANRTVQGRGANRYLTDIYYGNRASHLAQTDPTRADWMFRVVFDYGEGHYAEAAPDAGGDTYAQAWADAPPGAPWGLRQDPFSTFRSGFEVRTYRLCRRVLMFHLFDELPQNPCLVQSTGFQYREDPALTTLVSVVHNGFVWNGTAAAYLKKSMPPVEMAYQDPVIDPDLHFVDPDSLENVPGGLDGKDFEWVDLDSEGLSGILAKRGDGWYYKRNLSALPVSPPGEDPVVVSARFAPLERVASRAGLAEAHTQLLDLAGDGKKSLVQFRKPVPGFLERTDEGGWEAFQPFTSNPNLSWDDPNLKWIDLNGDGFADILVSEDDVFRWYPSLAKEGFGEGRSVARAQDEEAGPALVFADRDQSVFLADMTGDGLTDIVRVRRGEVCYWPNRGYGRFGAKVAMDRVPTFGSQEAFNPKRLRLADIDGSGTTDILYLGDNENTFWFNQAGNAFGPPQTIPQFADADSLASVVAVDLLGIGTSCLVWSSNLPGDAGRPLRYIDLMGGKKPHLLSSIDNHMGQKTLVDYAPSTRFYLMDKAEGKPWVTRLPFPVQVVAKFVHRDLVSGTDLTTRYRYHHGYYDGTEREFRGFGMVEQWDTEDYAAYAGDGLFKDPAARELYVPPAHTKTWFLTGAFFGREGIEDRLSGEFYRGDPQAWARPASVYPDAITLPDGTPLAHPTSALEDQEARRALKGRVLRREVYADDGPTLGGVPYSVEDYAYEVRLLQPIHGRERPGLENPHGVFYAFERESVSTHYERNQADPRVGHQLTLEVDPYGNVKRSASVGYPRRVPAYPEQGQNPILYTEADFANQPDGADSYRLGVPVENRVYEVTGILPSPASGPFLPGDLGSRIQAAAGIPYEGPTDTSLGQKRLLGRTRFLYCADDLSGPLAPGDAGSRALPYQSYRMAFTQVLADQAFGTKVTGTILADEGGYQSLDGAWWIPSERQVFDPARFYLPVQFVDPFGHATSVSYDAHSLLVETTLDAVGNLLTAQNHYRILKPWLLTDPNQNRSGIRFDVLGMVTATAVLGKDGAAEGDFLDLTTPEASPSDDPTHRLEYDLFHWDRKGLPVYAHTFSRERHGAANPRWQETYEYSDGFGREIMVKAQAEPGPVPQLDAQGKPVLSGGQLVMVETAPAPRWVGTGRRVFDNKGNPVKKYEPYFSPVPDFESEEALVEWGVTPVLHYDPLGRLRGIDNPDGTFTQVAFDPWHQTTSDANDLVLESRWYSDRGSPDPLGPEPADPQARSAWLAAQHAHTPAQGHFDSLGRAFLTQADNGSAGLYDTRLALDIEGNQRSVTDHRGYLVMTYTYDMAGRKIHWGSMDAGEHWSLENVVGSSLYSWDTLGRRFRHAYDPLHRSTHLWIQVGAGTETLEERTVYGELNPDAVSLNLRGRTFQAYDPSGVATNALYDFKANLLTGSRQAALNYKGPVDWSPLSLLTDPTAIAAAAAPLLDAEVLTNSTTYDALDRAVTLTAPDHSVMTPTYNEANFLARMDAAVRGGASQPYVLSVAYDAKGRRTSISYANGVATAYAYDPLTFRMTGLTTTRAGDSAVLQDLAYTYDPVGNTTEVEDGA